MSNTGTGPRPNLLQYLGYCYGRVLPDPMSDWVRDDLGGKGATARTMIRFAIPAIIVLAPFWLIPTTLYVHASMTLPIFLPYVMFTHVAKTSQAYTVVANAVGSGTLGSSGVFTINPVDAEAPVVASVDDAEAVSLAITTRGNPHWWMDQQRLIAGRLIDLVAPLMLPTDSAAFTLWRDSPGYDLSSWTAYSQSL